MSIIHAKTMPAVFLMLLMLSVSSCATKARSDYSLFRSENPKSVLVVPVVNRSVDVDAPDYYLSTISKPLAERGYYVYPVHLVKRLMEDEGLSDSNLVHSADPRRLGELFGADAVLYVTIERWDAQYVVLSTQVTVQFQYVLKSAKTGQSLWSTTYAKVFSPNSSSSGNLVADLIVDAVAAAIAKAKPNYLPLTRQANAEVVALKYQGLPSGPYSPKYLKDTAQYK